MPSNMLKEDEAVFLDGMSIDRTWKQLKVRIVAVEGFRDVVDVLRKKGERNK